MQGSFQRAEVQTQYGPRERNFTLTSTSVYLMLIIALLRDSKQNAAFASCK
jgi:hypothetical protein